MNHYGKQAQQHWARWRPTQYQQISDPETFFTKLGQETAQQIATLAADLAGDDPPGETYLQKMGRLNRARLEAEEIVLAETILLPPEPGMEDAGSLPAS